MRRTSIHFPAAESGTRLIPGAARSSAGCRRTPGSACGQKRCLPLTAVRAATWSTFRVSSRGVVWMPADTCLSTVYGFTRGSISARAGVASWWMPPGRCQKGGNARYRRGLTIIRSGQCPHIAKFATEIAATAEKEYQIRPKIVDLQSWSDAQNAPAPYAVFGLVSNGRLLADHQISRARFRNLMNRLAT